WVLAIVLVFSLAGLAACTQPAAEAPAQEAPAQEAPAQDAPADEGPSAGGYTFPVIAEEDIIIGFNNGSVTVDFLRLVDESMRKAADERGVKMIVAESNFDSEKVLPTVDNLLLQGANIIVDFNCNAEIGGALVDYCGERGVPVIGIDVFYEGIYGDTSWFFGANNEAAGMIAGEGLAEGVKERWDGEIDCLVLLSFSAGGELVYTRVQNIYEGLVASGVELSEDGVEFLDSEGSVDATMIITQKMTDWLTAHPDMHKIGIGGANTEHCQGAYAALQTSNRDADGLIVSHNNSFQTLAAFDQGVNSWLGGVAYWPSRYGDYIIPMSIDILTGKNPPKMNTMEHTFLKRGDEALIHEEMGE
ncbi:MAG: substrate-binding domain-containing protein, partial [Clostridiales bacterium]|nr:substrate-binding domain-containing protein [Clostridiales bacterium]